MQIKELYTNKEEINNYDPDIIRVNNKDVVVTKEKKEDE